MPEVRDAINASGASEAALAFPATVGAALTRTAAASPDKTALVGGGARYTFAEYDRLSDGLAASLHALGLRPGDTAMFQMGTVPETALALFGCFKAGVLPVCALPQHRCLLYTSPSPRDLSTSRMPSSA